MQLASWPSQPALPATASVVAPPPVAPAPAAVPDWIADVRRKYTLRVRDWVTQAWAMTHSPRQFMAEWSVGRRAALNPLRFLAVGTTVNFATDRAGRFLLHLASPPSVGWRGWFNGSTGAMGNVLLLGALTHAFLLWRSRAPFRSSLAASVFVSAGPGTFLNIFGWLLSGAVYAVRGSVPLVEGGGTPWPLPLIIVATFFLPWSVAMLAGVHRVAWWRPLVALVLSFVAISGAAVGIVEAARLFTHH